MNPSTQQLKELGPLVAQKFDTALNAGDAFFFDSAVHVTGDDVKEGMPAIASVPWQVRIVPALLKKPNANKEEKKDAPKQNKQDVFAPPYVPNLLVAEFPDYTVLVRASTNAAEQILAADADFVKQEMPPSPEMIATAYRIIQAHEPSSPGAEMLTFFNCGQDSGASQPHCHFQLVELTPTEGSAAAVPVENLLNRIERDGKEHDFVHMLPVPWQHFVVLLTPPADEAQLETYIGQRFTQVLDAMFSAEDDLAKLTDAPPRRGLPSFNILVTKQALHVIPRRREDFDLRTTDWAPFASGDAPEGTGTVSVNALGYAGLFLTRHESELEALSAEGNARIAHVLQQTGTPLPVVDAPEAQA